MEKMYFVQIPKKTGDGLTDFLEWSDTNLDSPAEMPNTPETIGKFVRDYMGYDSDLVPALFIEDENGNMIEYYVFKDSETLRHEKIKIESREMKLTMRVFDEIAPWDRGELTPEELKEQIDDDPYSTIEFLLDLLDNYR